MVSLLLAITLALPPAQDAAAAATPAPACIGVVMPAVQGGDGSATDAAEAARDLFVSYLGGPSLKVVPLEARLAAHGLEEARLKECSRVLIVTMTRKRSGGGGSRLGRFVGNAGSTAAWHLPAGSAGAAAARSAAAAGSQAVVDVASGTRAKDEIKVDWKLVTAENGKATGAGSDKAKASSDGEDLLTPLVHRISEAIVALPVR
jgi:hypothetical protein